MYSEFGRKEFKDFIEQSHPRIFSELSSFGKWSKEEKYPVVSNDLVSQFVGFYGVPDDLGSR